MAAAEIMDVADVTQVGIVGAGTMGAGIAEVFAEAGYHVVWYNRSETGIKRGLERLQTNQSTLVRAGVLTQSDAEAARTRLQTTTDLAALSSVDVISESIVETLEAKKALFHALDQICGQHTILTTNTSGLPISQLATVVTNPARFAGMHFANPPHLIPMVELVKGEKTSSVTYDLLTAMAQHLGKHPVRVQRDVPGFIANRLQFAVIREALHLIETGVAAPADIDAAVKHGIGLRWALLGPLEIADVGGLDVFHSIGQYLFQELTNTAEGSKVLDALVASEKFGAKSGAGFYDYPAGKAQEIIAQRDNMLLHLLQIKQSS